MSEVEGMFDGLDLSALFTGQGVEVVQDETAALKEVARRISGQYGEVLARFLARVFGGADISAELSSVDATIDSLGRLATASDNTHQLELLAELETTIQVVKTSKERSRARQGALVRLRAWIPVFAETLDDDDAERLRRTIEWDATELPLLSELRQIRGIGPKRLGRLYSAGLSDVETVANAAPEDIAAVTGIPRKIAIEVVAATRRYAVEERSRCVLEMAQRARRLHHILDTIPMASDSELANRAQDALRELQDAMALLIPTHNIP